MKRPLQFRLPVGTTTFRLPIFRKSLCLSETTTVDHFWLNCRWLYGKKTSQSELHETLLRIYWEVCSASGAFDERDTRETYLLAYLLPRMRTYGSRRVFLDARLSCRWEGKKARQRELNDLIRSCDDEELKGAEFRERVFAALNGRRYSREESDACFLLGQDLLQLPSLHLKRDRDQALRVLTDRWDNMQRRYGRRGASKETIALDILSYEARAAMHRCYSVAWYFLIPALDERFSLSEATRQFLTLWHMEQGCHAWLLKDGRDILGLTAFRPFHGSIFGLHPGTAAMIQTESGREAIADWLQSPLCERAIGQLLHAILISMHHYSGRYEEDNANRKRALPRRLQREFSRL